MGPCFFACGVDDIGFHGEAGRCVCLVAPYVEQQFVVGGGPYGYAQCVVVGAEGVGGVYVLSMFVSGCCHDDGSFSEHGVECVAYEVVSVVGSFVRSEAEVEHVGLLPGSCKAVDGACFVDDVGLFEGGAHQCEAGSGCHAVVGCLRVSASGCYGGYVCAVCSVLPGVVAAVDGSKGGWLSGCVGPCHDES